VLTTGSVNLRRFEQRPGEALVLGDLLDRTATVRDSGQRVTVVDAAMEQTRTRDWVLTRIAVRDIGSRLTRRRSQVRQVEWPELDGLGPAPEPDQGAGALLDVLSTQRPADLAAMLQDLTAKRRHEIAAALDDERLADVLGELPEEAQVKILASLADERAADILEEMDPDDAADLLNELPDAERERLIQLMEPGEAAPVRRLLRYGEDTAGGLMTSEPIILSPDATIAEALARVRNPDVTPALATQVYVCRPPSQTPTGRYLGVAHVQRLLREPPSALVSGVVDDDLEPLRPETELARVTRYLATYDLVAAAVVDETDRLVGAVTVDDVLDHLLPEDWRERDVDG
jgi:Mg/Co/Ni transporter MgtE